MISSMSYYNWWLYPNGAFFMAEGITLSLTELIALQQAVGPMLPHAGFSGQRQGAHLARVRGRGMSFAEARNYQAGDEIRHMAWRMTARTGKPHVKLYHEERERPVMVVADFNASMYFGTRCAFKSYIAAQLAALIAWTALSHHDRIGGLLFTDHKHYELMPKAGKAGIVSMLSMLSQLTHQETASLSGICTLNSMLMRLRRVVKPGTLVVIISDFYHVDEDTKAQFMRLAQHHDVVAYHVCDPFECAPEPQNPWG